MCSGLLGSTAMLVSFCGVWQPRLDAPLLFTASPVMASMSLVAAYAPVVLKGAERHRPTAVAAVSRLPSSPTCAHGALMSGANLQLWLGAAELTPGNIATMPVASNGTEAKATSRWRSDMRSPGVRRVAGASHVREQH